MLFWCSEVSLEYQAAHSKFTSQNTSVLKKDLDNLIKTPKSARINPDENKKVNDQKAQYQAAETPEALIQRSFFPADSILSKIFPSSRLYLSGPIQKGHLCDFW